MIGYSTIETAMRRRLIEHFSTLSEELCQVSDVDLLFSNIMESDALCGCLIDFAGGGEENIHPFKEPVWTWEIGGVFYIRYRGDPVETDRELRVIIDRLTTIFKEDARLYGTAAKASVVTIEPPDPGKINDIPFYWLPFMVRVIDH